ELCKISTGKGNTQDKVENGKYPFYVRSENIERSNYFLYDQEAVLTVGDGVGTGRVFHYVSGKYNLHQRVYRMYDFNKQISAKYFYYYFSLNFHRRVRSLTAKTSVDSVRLNMIADMEIKYPSELEQLKIFSFLDYLIKSITLHQRKLEQLKELKKAYLQLMFPKKDETVPRVRFADFEDDWQLCKLGDVVEIFDGTHQTPRYTDSGVKFVSVENIATLETKKYITHEAYEKEYSKKRAKKGDILMTRIGDIGTMKVIETDEPLAYYVTLALLKAKETNPYFLSFIISSPEIQRNIWKRTLHIAFPKKINLGEINQVEMKITIFEEQDKIGDLFTNLDDAIILNQNKLNQLKSLKKSYLQNMFI
ncbi:TPA: restriction endonuclease subunit S, partial [Enterococcus faecalis]